MSLLNIDINSSNYESIPFPHIIIDNILTEKCLEKILIEVNNLNNTYADSVFCDSNSPYEFNKFAFNKNLPSNLKNLFIELTSKNFIQKLEKLTGINGIISDSLELQGAGVHRIENKGFLQIHTDFNTYHDNIYGKLDRRINLLIYLNTNWDDKYKGHLWLCDKYTKKCVKKISPILNRCVIFSTTNNSLHGHPESLNVPDNIKRHSIALYYYTKNINQNTDFEGDSDHNTLWHFDIKD